VRGLGKPNVSNSHTPSPQPSPGGRGSVTRCGGLGVSWVMPQPLDYAPAHRGFIPATVTRLLRRLLPYLVATFVCYVGSYACMSSFGEFQPGVIGAHGVKFYMWSPAGFHTRYRQRWWLYWAYLPLWKADERYWHPEGNAYNGKYPTSTPSTAAEWAEWSR